MSRITKYINNNLLFKIASFNSFAVVVKILSGFLTSKAIAVYVGAEGYALVGNLRNLLTSIQSFSILGLYNGIVKYVSEYKNDSLKLNESVSTIFTLIFISTILISGYCFFNANSIAIIVFGSSLSYSYIIKLLALTLPLYAVNTFLIAIVNGLSKHRLYVRINIVGQILGLVSTLFLIWQKQLDGALIAIVIMPLILFVISIIVIFKFKKLFYNLKIKCKLNTVKKLSSYSVMTLFSSIIIPMLAFAIRKYIIENVGQEEAGFWEAISRFSNYYLMFVTTLVTLYLLPKLSSINTDFGFKKAVFHFYKNVIPFFALGLLFIYFFRKIIIKIVLTDAFEPIEDLFFWQLLGDFIKVLSLVLSYQFVAKKMIKHYLVVETISVITIYLSSVYFIDIFGLKGVVIAHFVSFLFHFSILILIFNKSLFKSRDVKYNNND